MEYYQEFPLENPGAGPLFPGNFQYLRKMGENLVRYNLCLKTICANRVVTAFDNLGTRLKNELSLE